MNAELTQEKLLLMPFQEFDALDLFQAMSDEGDALAILIDRKRRRMSIYAGEMVTPPATVDEINDVRAEAKEKYGNISGTILGRPACREPSHILDWRTMPAGNSKRHAYYASREWALIKAKVRERSGGMCERCYLKPADQVHHQTYERLYAEQLTDLLHVCDGCHEYLSGK